MGYELHAECMQEQTAALNKKKLQKDALVNIMADWEKAVCMMIQRVCIPSIPRGSIGIASAIHNVR